MGEYKGFSKRQLAYMRGCAGCWLNVCEGGKRAGKNVCNVLAFSRNIEGHKDKLHLAAGVSIAAAKMNILDCNGLGLLNYFRGRASVGAYQGKQALTVRLAGGAEKVVIFAGGGRAGDAALIKGNSYGSAYISEANECNEEFFREVMDRTLASADRRLFFDLNPKAPGHWFYRDFLDLQDERAARGLNPGYQYARFTMADNMSISDAALKAALATYDQRSPWFQAEILGRRVAAGGRIYDFDGGRVLFDAGDLKDVVFEAYAVGVDIGGTDATAATLVGFTAGFRACMLLDGYYHKQGKSGHGYTHDRYAKDITARLKEWGGRFEGFLEKGTHVFCESADKLFRQALADEIGRAGLGLRVVPSYKRDGVTARIRLTAMLLHQGRYKVARHMAPWIEAYENATWKEGARLDGRWERLDNGSCPIDALDSAEYAVQPYSGRLIRDGGKR